MFCGIKIGAEHGTSLVVQWLRIRILLQGGVVSIPDRGTKIPHCQGATKLVCCNEDPAQPTKKGKIMAKLF